MNEIINSKVKPKPTIKQVVFKWEKFFEINQWCMWFWSAVNSDFLFFILIITTLIKSKSGYNTIPNESKILLIWFRLLSITFGFKIWKRKIRFTPPKNKDPASPRKIFLLFLKLKK